jgi:hypothetical protein
MPAVRGILETAISVSDLPRAAAYYRRLFDFATLLDSESCSRSMWRAEMCCSYFSSGPQTSRSPQREESFPARRETEVTWHFQSRLTNSPNGYGHQAAQWWP